MSSIEMLHLYIEAWVRTTVGRTVDDDRGATTAEMVVLIGVSLAMAAAVGVLLWGKLTDGANNVEVPAPGAP